jgi:hypothetical protein
MTKSGLRQFIDGQNLGVLGTISPEGQPQSALVGIAVTESLEIIFDTLNSSRKYRNLIAHPTACFVIGWAGEVTVQYEGVAHETTGTELARFKQVYLAKLPDSPTRESWPGIAYFVVRPTWARYSDYDQTPTLIEEFNF